MISVYEGRGYNLLKLTTCFEEFLKEIRPTPNQRSDYKKGHETLRERLEQYEGLKDIIVTTFLQGSYRRFTAVRPKGEKRPDVDVIVVTRLKKENYPEPKKAMDLFKAFLEKYYSAKYKPQSRSFGIELSYVDLDLVITSAPSEAQEEILKSPAVSALEVEEEYFTDWSLKTSWLPLLEVNRTMNYRENLINEKDEWKTEPLLIPDRDADTWERTHPLEQIKWTQAKNARSGKHYVNVVKAIKWWWQEVTEGKKRPSGYPLERIVGECCPDGIESVAEGITNTFEQIIAKYRVYALTKQVPTLSDHGIGDNNVLKRISCEEFAIFYKHAENAARTAREALDTDEKEVAIDKWRKLFGIKFPLKIDNDNKKESSNGYLKIKSQSGDQSPRRYGK